MIIIIIVMIIIIITTMARLVPSGPGHADVMEERHYLSNATCPIRPHVLSTALQHLSDTAK